jgi:AmmeMemoRadiSam system protein A
MTVLCEIAVGAIETALVEGERRRPDLAGLAAPLIAPGASFVTLERTGHLLGCVGTLEARQPLAWDVAEHAVAAAFDDPRMPALTVDDFPDMAVKVSVLTASTPVHADSFDELREMVQPGVDGVTVEAGRSRATLLPSVWSRVRDCDEFLDVLWAKAGLRRRTWPRGVRVLRYGTVDEQDPGPRPTPRR